MSITFKEFTLNLIETALLNENQPSYTIKEIKELVNSAVENYEFEYNTTVNISSDIMSDIEQLLVSMNIELIK
ncbi:hypothetical protein [Halalkalibacter oceani]|uniref:hypothetical protein n=1 Tax=Halalkalibacter oceani TaxID=1653776 RepID=UPI003391ADAD